MIFKDQPIKQKVRSIILLTCSVVLVLMCLAYIGFEYISFKRTVRGNLETVGWIIASNSSAALAFDSPQDAEETLSALKANPSIVAAALYDVEGNLFATYPGRLPKSSFPTQPGEGYHFNKGKLEGFQRVEQNNLYLGTLYLKSDLRGMYQQMKATLFIALLLIAATLIIAYILSNYLQGSISAPILSLKQLTNDIAASKNYSLRAVKSGDDEIGDLTLAFNQMLEQIELRNQAVAEANQESLKLAAIVESSGDAIIGAGLDLMVSTWNNAAERLLGYTASEITGVSLSSITGSDTFELLRQLIAQLENGDQIDPFETEFLAKDEKKVEVSLTISPIRDSSGIVTGVSVIARDITEQKRNEQLIIKNEEHLRLATQAAELGTFDWDLKQGLLIWDKRCRYLFGVAEEAPIDYTQSFILSLHPDDRPRVQELIDLAFNRTLSGGRYDTEYRTLTRGGKLRWLRARGQVFFNEDNTPARFLGAVLDITGQKQEEIRKNDFIAIISHELKTPLTTIKSYVQILLQKARQNGDAFTTNALVRTNTQANKMTSMIRDFLQLARIEEGKIQISREEFELYPLLEEVLEEAALLTSTHTFHLEGCNNAKIYADRDKISQVLINLLSNAIKYSPPDSDIRLGCELRGNQVKVFVTDKGVGIKADDQKNLFTRFYRVENEKIKTVSGFGIGLYLVSEILKHHQSQIMIESKEGEGSVFHFTLEAIEAEVRPNT